MKLITAIVQNRDARQVANALINGGFQVTQTQTIGAFLQEKNNTLLIATDDKKVDQAIKIIEENSKTRSHIMPPMIDFAQIDSFGTNATEVQIGGATIFVQNIEQFKKI